MKKLSLILAVFMLLSLFAAIPVSADDDDAQYIIKKGTPVIDGVIDGIYLDSAFTEVEQGSAPGYSKNCPSVDDPAYGDMYGKVYYLWDDDCLYFCADIKDSDPAKNTAEYYAEAGCPWVEDSVEIWVGYENRNLDQVHIGAWSDCFYYWGEDRGVSMFQDDYINYKVVPTDDGFIIECAMKIDADYNFLAAGNEIGLKEQLNDIAVEGQTDGMVCAYTDVDDLSTDGYTLTAEAAVDPNAGEPTSEEPASEEPASEEPASEEPASEPGNVPATSDAGIAVAVIVMAAAAAVVLKNRKH
ncbi:MAG: hypothetical protein II719_01320 [Clostridia bacterium]|nr:hypothetical protein [Clostridia bacterium]